MSAQQFRPSCEEHCAAGAVQSEREIAQSPAMPNKRIAVMQPYFFPYAGYFRLFHLVDEFVIFDCVQFPRRGRVHRTQVPGPRGKLEWLTLPLAHHRRDVLIRDLAFASDARARFDERLARFAWIHTSVGPAANRIRDHLFSPFESVIDYLEGGLRLVTDILELPVRISRSSALGLDPSLRGQARVIAAAKSVGATCYLNSPGGRALYDAGSFGSAGIELCFLSPYHGSFFHLLLSLMKENPKDISQEIRETSSLER
jgi:hypothetical protein